jgi:hypothetical protein
MCDIIRIPAGSPPERAGPEAMRSLKCNRGPRNVELLPRKVTGHEWGQPKRLAM